MSPFQGSVLHTIMGELPLLSGKVFVQGKIAYAAQNPWVFSSSVRENILFGKPFNASKYTEVVKGILSLFYINIVVESTTSFYIHIQ